MRILRYPLPSWEIEMTPSWAKQMLTRMESDLEGISMVWQVWYILSFENWLNLKQTEVNMSIFTYGRPVWMISGSKSCLTSADVVSFGDEGARVGTMGKTNSPCIFWCSNPHQSHWTWSTQHFSYRRIISKLHTDGWNINQCRLYFLVSLVS